MKFKKSRKTYLHIDCDSFFAYCEIIKNPSLKGKIVGVGSEIIVACSYEAKKLGIYTGMPIWEAEKLTKGKGIFLKPDMIFYSEISLKFINYLKKKTINVEQFSIDEAFCEISGLPEYYKLSLDNYLKKLQKDILNEIGISVSIGCSNTKIKAKIYSKLNKPFGIFNGYNIDEIDNFKNLELKLVPFIGKKTQEKLKYQAKTIHDFLKMGYWKLDNKIGKNATDLRLELNGVDQFKVKKSNVVKSFSRSRSFNNNITKNYNFLENELIKHFEYVFEELYEKNLLVKNIGILLRDREFNTHYFHIILAEHSNNRKILLKAALKGLQNNYNSCLEYRSTGVVFADFKSFLPRQLNLSAVQNLSTNNNFTLNKTILELNRRYGDNTIKYGINNILKSKLKTRFIT